MATNCEYCTGSHWLMDDVGLGQCVCCTPATMTALEADVASLRTSLTERTAAVGDRDTDLTEADEVVGQALDALRSYFRSINVPSDPVRLDDKNLDAMFQALAGWRQ